MFSDLLKQGKTIRISKRGLTTTEFHFVGAYIYCYNKKCGIFRADYFTEHITDFDKHINAMLEQNCTITIY